MFLLFFIHEEWNLIKIKNKYGWILSVVKVYKLGFPPVATNPTVASLLDMSSQCLQHMNPWLYLDFGQHAPLWNQTRGARFYSPQASMSLSTMTINRLSFYIPNLVGNKPLHTRSNTQDLLFWRCSDPVIHHLYYQSHLGHFTWPFFLLPTDQF